MSNQPRGGLGATLANWIEERSARKWVELMIRDRPRYERQFERWASAKPGRRERYDAIVRAVNTSPVGAEGVARPQPGNATIARWWWLSEIVATPTFAALALLLIAGATFHMVAPMFGKGSQEKASEYAVDNRAYHNEIGQVRSIRLSDGSTVVLDTDSAMMVQFDVDKREIWLINGRARFEVAHDRQRPFVVTGRGGKVVAIGTMFDLSVRNGFEVQLLKGSVEVTLPSTEPDAPPHAPLILHPGQKILFTAEDGQASIHSQKIRPSDEQWVSGVKLFDDVAAREVVAEANTYSTIKIEFADPALADKPVVIQCDIRNISDVAEGLATLFRLQVDRSQPGKIILK